MTARPALSGPRLPRPRKRFGQHFLEPAWVVKVVDALDAKPGDDVFQTIAVHRNALVGHATVQRRKDQAEHGRFGLRPDWADTEPGDRSRHGAAGKKVSAFHRHSKALREARGPCGQG